MRLREKLSDAKSRVQRRIGGQEESAITRGAKPDQTGQRGLRERARRRARQIDREKARRALQKAGNQVDGVEAQAVGERHEDVADRAERAATMGDPIGATLDPADPLNVDKLADGSAGRDEPAEQRGVGVDIGMPNPMEAGDDADEPTDDLLSFGGGEPDQDDPLAVDDDVLGIGGED